MKIFFIFGYGVPKDILADDNYNVYLRTVFNRIFELSGGREARLVFCGGATNCISPYEGTEAGEMRRFFERLVQETGVGAVWELVEQDRAINGLENLLFGAELVDDESEIVIFCEYLRGARIRELASMVFSGRQVLVEGIDFDTSASRYIINNGEREASLLAWERRAVSDEIERKRLHDGYEKKLVMLRAAPPEKFHEVMDQWYREYVARP